METRRKKKTQTQKNLFTMTWGDFVTVNSIAYLVTVKNTLEEICMWDVHTVYNFIELSFVGERKYVCKLTKYS